MMTLSQIENFLQLLGFRPDSAPNTYHQDTTNGRVLVRHNNSGSGILIEGPQGLVGGSASHGRHLLSMLATAGWSVSEIPS
ncbi:hypothetical protein [Hymenobacter sp. GOD-10R]|uniref:hypothetical protein n=1 Tax=Hymenobacter sp. GOD-10R TaxID=3093922 RepID=UPI002D77E5B7|nr:hypothetical protein [Hymenobacter sp. GOD-10R]WRQ27154.1 hypothetical protein SD425_18950 [Hymenobacter sp. GOD-10R]